jgi:hypothetical protein
MYVLTNSKLIFLNCGLMKLTAGYFCLFVHAHGADKLRLINQENIQRSPA